MPNLLNEIYKLIISDEEAQRRAASFERAMGTEDFEFIKDAVLVIKREIMKDMLSKSFTNLDNQEKDVRQRVYYHLNDMLDFFYSPIGWTRKKKLKWPTQGKANHNPGGK